jgi:SAM-dependent methyltransferase
VERDADSKLAKHAGKCAGAFHSTRAKARSEIVNLPWRKIVIKRNSLRTVFLALSLTMALAAGSVWAQQAKEYQPEVGQAGKDVVWVPTPQALVDKMLDMAKVTPKDYVIDLGSGDGRTVITAAKRGSKALGIEYNPDMVELSKRSAAKEGVSDKASFVKADLFESDLSQAQVITMFLLPSINLKLRPKILDLKPGTRIVSNSFDMEEWKPDETATVEGCNNWCTAHLWIVPAKVGGTWKLRQGELTLKQTFQMITGTLRNGNVVTPVTARRSAFPQAKRTTLDGSLAIQSKGHLRPAESGPRREPERKAKRLKAEGRRIKIKNLPLLFQNTCRTAPPSGRDPVCGVLETQVFFGAGPGIDLEFIAVRIQEIRLLAPEDSLVTVFDVKHIDAVLTQKFYRRLEIFRLHPERVMHRRSLGRIVFHRRIALGHNKIILAALEKNHARRLLDDLHAEQLVIKLRAAVQIGGRQTEMQHALSFDHDRPPLKRKRPGATCFKPPN